MTDIDLQIQLIKELKEMCRAESLMKQEGDFWSEYHIYQQDKPYKEEESSSDQEDYIIVMIGDEDTDKDGCWIVDIHFVISIVLMEESNQGNLILANLMNQIYMWMRRKGIIGKRYVMETEAHKRFNEECVYPYFECDLITKWKLPPIHQEGLEELL